MKLFNQILFDYILFESLEWDLNPRPTDLQSAVLPTELSRDNNIYLFFLYSFTE